MRVHGIIDEGRRERRFFHAHQPATRRIFDFGDLSSKCAQQLGIVPQTSAPLHQVTVIVGDALGDPQAARVCRPSKIPGAEFNRPQPFDVPDVKKFVSNAVNRRF